MPRQEGNQMHVILTQRAGRKNAPKTARPQDGSGVAEPTTEES
jgi:hypothetical protein